MREPVSFTNANQKIIGVLHYPENPTGLVSGVVIFHGFTGQKVEPHRIFVKLAEALVAQGIAALRFDFRGSGDSEGDFVDMTVENEISDALRGLEFLSQQSGVDPERIGVLGLSLGGAVAACVSGRSPLVKSTVLWSAVADFNRIDSFLEAAAIAGTLGQVDIGGNVVGRNFFAGLPDIKPYREILQAKGPILIVHGTNDTSVPVQHAGIYADALAGAGHAYQVHIIEGADHTYNRREWEAEAIDVAVNWFTKAL